MNTITIAIIVCALLLADDDEKLQYEKQPKAIQTPQCEKVELNRSENAWVRCSIQDKDLCGNAKEIKVIYRYNLFTVKI